MEFLLLFLVYALIFGFFCAYLAGEKGRSSGSWLFLGLIFGILALLVLIGLPSKQDPSSEDRRSSTRSSAAGRGSRSGRQGSDARLCPHCIQEVHELATACPHCQRDLPAVERCSYGPCLKIINPIDDRCEDEEGNPYCSTAHRTRNIRTPFNPYNRSKARTVKCKECGVEVYESNMSAHVISGCTSMR